MSGNRKIEKDRFLFREGDSPDAMYVVKSGKFAVVKTKSSGEIVLAEIGPGAMVGEMAFFDQQPRSASVKAVKESEVIALPYRALYSQFQSFPEWAKAIMKQVSKNLRTANARIKQLEKNDVSEEEFPPHSLTKLMAILCFVADHYGIKEAEGVQIPAGTLRNTTIQIFQESTFKLQKLIHALASLKMMTIEDLGEGKQRLHILKLTECFQFFEWLNEWLFKKETDQISISERDLKLLRAVGAITKDLKPNHRGQVQINLNFVIENARDQLGLTIKMEEFEILIGKRILTEKFMKEGQIVSSAVLEDLNRSILCWTLYHDLINELKNPSLALKA